MDSMSNNQMEGGAPPGKKKPSKWGGLLVQVHKLAGLIGHVPVPMLLGVCMWIALISSAYGTSLMGKFISAEKAKKSRFLAFVRGHDAAFGIFYVVNAFGLALIVFLLTLVARVPLTVIAGLVISTLGVTSSVAMEMVCATADDDDFRAQEATREAMLRRRVYLHGAMGISVATVVLLMTKVSYN
jgi:predicted cation transporter